MSVLATISFFDIAVFGVAFLAFAFLFDRFPERRYGSASADYA